ncbi:MAG: trehalose-6-phosphate synthase [Thermanaeromonas sp.]|uniref:alpha,alpha-trehalose-phosphate synthase (UDP-forming) n=1 Tax=Thermanaeromonas sp. TaxID=2003697 RepID=UPI002440CDAA|nr:trehalose-6-phosphate synthase [Thermanaeromonas sp.]MCG0278239.1 trehalose-6-phosphate synthase [Thermanaeromonas sp.]
MLKEPKIVLVSNRGSYTLKEIDGKIEAVPAISGLVSAVEPVLKEKGGVWVAWGGREAAAPETPGVRLNVPPENPAYLFCEVPLTGDEIRRYYHGFTNGALWPLCHYFLEKCRYSNSEWLAYRQVNFKFALAALAETGPQDIVWVNDYHLALVPGIIRRHKPGLKQAFFWHIPFPHYDLFATLPWARAILRGLLGSDVIGFHLPDYSYNFLHAVNKLLEAPVDYNTFTIRWQGRKIFTPAWPMGIDYEAFQKLACDPKIRKQAEELRRQIGTERIALAVERLDYTKGILERLLAFERFLEEAPEWRGRVSLLQIAVPSRTAVPAYQQLRSQVEEAVGRINGRFSEGNYRPVHYFWRGIPRQELVSYYLAADIMMVTPLRDGLNLVAKEYVASRVDGTGVLILSRFAGAARDLKEAVIINPYDIEGTVVALKAALAMPVSQQKQRLRKLQEQVRRFDVRWWLANFQRALQEREVKEEDAVRRHLRVSSFSTLPSTSFIDA